MTRRSSRLKQSMSWSRNLQASKKNRERSDSKSFGPSVERLHDQVRCETRTRPIEAILTSLCPIERAIVQTPACTIGGLGVRPAAYVVSEYWEAPLERINRTARVIRLLIEAICDFPSCLTAVPATNAPLDCLPCGLKPDSGLSPHLTG